jgi:signal transduction histidine kinase
MPSAIRSDLRPAVLADRLPENGRAPAGDARPAAEPVSSAARAEFLAIRVLAFFRAAGLAEIASVLVLDWRHYRSWPAILALTGAVTAESVVLVVAAARRGALRPSWIVGDVTFLVGCLAVGAALTAPADGQTWVYFMYPFSLFGCYSIGIAFGRLADVMTLTAVLASGYALSAVGIHHDRLWNVMPNAVGYFANTAVTWAVARELRRGARAADASRAQAIAQAEDLARERERARHARILHDHALQTLESLVRHRSVADDAMHSHIAAAARRLRALVEGTPLDEPADLLSRLHELVAVKTAAGLHVEFNSAQLQASEVRRCLPREVSEAVVGAAHEALTNVAKHAAVAAAVVRATATNDRLTVSILDHGIGFDPEQTPWGVGLEKSITDRILEVGGTACIESAPGAGTYVELTIPSAAWNGSVPAA